MLAQAWAFDTQGQPRDRPPRTGKESQHVLSLSDPAGSTFKLLCVPCDTELTMANSVSEQMSSAGWKLELSFVLGVSTRMLIRLYFIKHTYFAISTTEPQQYISRHTCGTQPA